MRVLENGQVRCDAWVLVEDDATPASGHGIFDLARFVSKSVSMAAENVPLGVRLRPADPVEALAPWIRALSLVALEMPAFRDGRAFSQARSLREQLEFTKDIRVLGQPLPDQYLFLLRCGVTSVALPEGSDVAAWQKAGRHFSVAYQDSVRNEPAMSMLRRRLATQPPAV